MQPKLHGPMHPDGDGATATNGWLTSWVRLITPSVIAAISPSPDDRPSSPSMKLMLLIIPAIQRIEMPLAIGYVWFCLPPSVLCLNTQP